MAGDEEIRDARAMRALAHPLRLKMLDRIRADGPCTATDLAVALETSTASTSYHLSQLHKHGFIEEAPEAGTGRQRPWRAVRQSLEWSAGTDQAPEEVEAARYLRDTWIAQRLEPLQAYLANEDLLDDDWSDATFVAAARGYVTADELRELHQRLRDLFVEYRRRDPSERPEGARLVRLLGFGVPDLTED